MTAWQQMGTVITVGRVLLQQFKMIDHLVPGLTNREIRYLGTILKHFDDNTAYIPAKKRQNRIGAHYFMANTTIANRWGKDESSVREMLNNWKNTVGLRTLPMSPDLKMTRYTRNISKRCGARVAPLTWWLMCP